MEGRSGDRNPLADNKRGCKQGGNKRDDDHDVIVIEEDDDDEDEPAPRSTTGRRRRRRQQQQQQQQAKPNIPRSSATDGAGIPTVLWNIKKPDVPRSSTDEAMLGEDYVIKDADVICTSIGDRHLRCCPPGNRRLRALVALHVERFRAAKTRTQVKRLTNGVVNLVRAGGGRFVVVRGGEDGGGGGGCCCYDIGNRRACKKVVNMFRRTSRLSGDQLSELVRPLQAELMLAEATKNENKSTNVSKQQPRRASVPVPVTEKSASRSSTKKRMSATGADPPTSSSPMGTQQYQCSNPHDGYHHAGAESHWSPLVAQQQQQFYSGGFPGHGPGGGPPPAAVGLPPWMPYPYPPCAPPLPFMGVANFAPVIVTPPPPSVHHHHHHYHHHNSSRSSSSSSSKKRARGHKADVRGADPRAEPFVVNGPENEDFYDTDDDHDSSSAHLFEPLPVHESPSTESMLSDRSEDLTRMLQVGQAAPAHGSFPEQTPQGDKIPYPPVLLQGPACHVSNTSATDASGKPYHNHGQQSPPSLGPSRSMGRDVSPAGRKFAQNLEYDCDGRHSSDAECVKQVKQPQQQQHHHHWDYSNRRITERDDNAEDRDGGGSSVPVSSPLVNWNVGDHPLSDSSESLIGTEESLIINVASFGDIFL